MGRFTFYINPRDNEIWINDNENEGGWTKDAIAIQLLSSMVHACTGPSPPPYPPPNTTSSTRARTPQQPSHDLLLGSTLLRACYARVHTLHPWIMFPILRPWIDSASMEHVSRSQASESIDINYCRSQTAG